MRLKRFISAVIAVIISASLFSGCTGLSGRVSDTVGSRFLSLWARGDYHGMYDMLDADKLSAEDGAGYTEDEFCERLKNIYETLLIYQTELVESMPVRDENGYVLPFTLAYHSSLFGDMEFRDMRLKLAYNIADNSYHVVWEDSLIFPGLENNCTVRLKKIPQDRGEILTAGADVLAANGHALSIVAVPGRIDDENAFCRDVAEFISLSADDIREKLHSYECERDGLVVLQSMRESRLDLSARAALAKIKGITIDTQIYTPVREYPEGSTLAHAIGYMTGLQENDDISSAAYSAAERIGRTGLEAAYEELLAGETGFDLGIYDENGEKLSTVWSRDAVDGTDLILTIDLGMQKMLEDKFQELLGDQWPGAMLVINPKTGDINAAVSYPSFDLNLFSYALTDEEWTALSDNPLKPMFPRYQQGLYPPGSTIKPLIASKALDEGIIDKDFIFPYENQIQDKKWLPAQDNWYYPPISRSSDYDGRVSLRNAITYSDNIFFAYLSMLAGEETMLKYLDSMGFGSNFDFDLPISRSAISNSGRLDDIKLLADTGYGQGELLVTPLQMCSLFTAYLNGGNVIKPRLVSEFKRMNPDDKASYETVELTEEQKAKYYTESGEIAIEGMLGEKGINDMLPILENVVNEGTGRLIGIRNMKIAGKTGTAEIGNNKEKTISWFIGFVADGTCDRLVCVMLETPADKGTEEKLTLAREAFLYGLDIDGD